MPFSDADRTTSHAADLVRSFAQVETVAQALQMIVLDALEPYLTHPLVDEDFHTMFDLTATAALEIADVFEKSFDIPFLATDLPCSKPPKRDTYPTVNINIENVRPYDDIAAVEQALREVREVLHPEDDIPF